MTIAPEVVVKSILQTEVDTVSAVKQGRQEPRASALLDGRESPDDVRHIATWLRIKSEEASRCETLAEMEDLFRRPTLERELAIGGILLPWQGRCMQYGQHLRVTIEKLMDVSGQ